MAVCSFYSECWGQAKHEGVICGLFICFGRLALEEQCTFCIRTRKNLTAYASLSLFLFSTRLLQYVLHCRGIHKMEQIWIAKSSKNLDKTSEFRLKGYKVSLFLKGREKISLLQYKRSWKSCNLERTYFYLPNIVTEIRHARFYVRSNISENT